MDRVARMKFAGVREGRLTTSEARKQGRLAREVTVAPPRFLSPTLSTTLEAALPERERFYCPGCGRTSVPLGQECWLYEGTRWHHACWSTIQDLEAKRYPYEDGDMTILGPEIFASSDGAVICWRGVNYVLQAERAHREGEK